MKTKIKEALKQGHKNLGLGDEVFERVAASVETFITEESQIAGFVASEGTLNLLKSYQSVNDKLRALENKPPKNEPNPKPSDPANNPEPKPEPTPQPNGEMAQLIKLMQEQNEQMRKQNEALTARFDAFETAQKSKNTLANAKSTFEGNDYVKKYADERDYAWERAMEMYEATGKTWTAEQLNEKAMGYFNKAVAKKGVDTSKPFESEGGGKDNASRFQEMRKRLEDNGVIAKETN